ncbi:MAG: hypothetical protein L6R37_002108 [Teloschistes peruensis]|nr:MAG: hypothetical protein L6R37_002108 [Teloschistes peruensis]
MAEPVSPNRATQTQPPEPVSPNHATQTQPPEPVSPNHATQTQTQPPGMAKSRCAIAIKRGCSIVVEQSVRAKVIVTREPVLMKCDCHQPEYHQIQLKAIREVIEAYDSREQVYIQLRKLFAEIVLRTRAIADTMMAEYLQMEKEDMKRFTGLPNRTGSDGFDLQKAEAAIQEFVTETVHGFELYLSYYQGHLRKVDECSRRVEHLFCSPYVPRHLDALGLVVQADTKDQQSQDSQLADSNKDSAQKVEFSDEVAVLESNARDDQTLKGHWRATQVKIRFTPQGFSLTACLDTGAGLSLLDSALLRQYLPEEPITPLQRPLKFIGISNVPIMANSYITVPLFLLGRKADGSRAFAKLCRRKIYIVGKCNVGMLVANDIIGPERITIDIAARMATVGSCGVDIVVQPRREDDLRLIAEERRTSTVPSYASKSSDPSANSAQTLVSDNQTSPVGLIQKKIMDHEIRTAALALDQRLQEAVRQEQHCRKTMMPAFLAHVKVLHFWMQYYATDEGKRKVRAGYERAILARYALYIPSLPEEEHLKVDECPFMTQKVREYSSEWYWGPEVLERVLRQTLIMGSFWAVKAYGFALSELMERNREEDEKLKSVMRGKQEMLIGWDGKLKVEKLMELMQ